jgi:predicted ATP-binding protein involved in virulence
MQRFAYNIIKSHSEQPSPKDPLLLIIIGVAGTGKSYLIHAIRNLLQACCAITATTGKASYNIGGSTIHSLLKLPTKTIKEILSTKRRQETSGIKVQKGAINVERSATFATTTCMSLVHLSVVRRGKVPN